MDRKKIQRAKLIIAIVVVLIIAIIVVARIVKYQKEGEKNMPYSISKIIVVSTANKYEKNESEANNDIQQNLDDSEGNSENQENQNENQNNSIWNFDLIQNNDIYISVEKNEENIKDEEKIKSISIGNIQISQAPLKGTLKAYMPNSLDGEKYKYTDDYIVSESLTYRSSNESNFKYLVVSNNGGTIGISFANTELGTYSSGDDTEITYNGTMLSKVGITNEDVKSKVSFDLIIELDDGKKYSGRIDIDINCDGLVENGTTQMELTDFSSVVFKRI